MAIRKTFEYPGEDIEELAKEIRQKLVAFALKNNPADSNTIEFSQTLRDSIKEIGGEIKNLDDSLDTPIIKGKLIVKGDGHFCIY